MNLKELSLQELKDLNNKTTDEMTERVSLLATQLFEAIEKNRIEAKDKSMTFAQLGKLTDDTIYPVIAQLYPVKEVILSACGEDKNLEAAVAAFFNHHELRMSK